MQIWRRIGIWVKVGIDYIASFPPLKAGFLDSAETIKYAVRNRKSIIRFGDGEFKILDGGNVHYQKFDLELQMCMQQIIDSYSDDSPYLLCMPHKYFSKSNLILNRRVLISCWSTPKRMFKRMINQSTTYGDAFVFAKNNNEIYNELWKDYTTVVMLHNDRKYFANACTNQKGYFIPVPSRDSFSQIDNIEREIIRLYNSEVLSKDKTVVLVSAGPMAKVLTYRLSQKGYIVIDCGHIWDDPLEV